MTYYQVMPEYLDFLDVYGSPFGEDKDLHFSDFRSDKVLINPLPGNVIEGLCRSGRRYQLCYNLKTVSKKESSGNETIWKIRQSAIYHQFDVGYGTQFWMIGDPHLVLKERIGEIYNDQESHKSSFSATEGRFKSSLKSHLVCVRWACENWRSHLLSLEEMIDYKVSLFLP